MLLAGVRRCPLWLHEGRVITSCLRYAWRYLAAPAFSVAALSATCTMPISPFGSPRGIRNGAACCFPATFRTLKLFVRTPRMRPDYFAETKRTLDREVK